MPDLKQVANHPELLALTIHNHGDMCAVGFPGSYTFWSYDAASEEAMGDGSTVIRPANRLVTQPGRWKICALGVKAASIGHAAFQAASGVLRDSGRKHINVLRLAADVADGETVTIGDDVYEFDDDDDFTEGNIQVDVSGGLTPALAGAALVEKINELGGEEQILATALSANEILIESIDVASIEALACAETLGGANNGWGAAAMYGGRAPAVRKVVAASRVPTAQEVALGRMHFLLDFTPSAILVDVRVTATGVAKLYGGARANVAGLVTLTNGTDPDFAATDTVQILAFE